MSTDVAEPEVFTMPSVPVGWPVQWFAGAERSHPCAGHIHKAHLRSVSIITCEGKLMEQAAVRHIDDPDLKQNEKLREFGAWDFMPGLVPGQVGHDATVSGLVQAVERLTRRVEQLERSKK